MTPRRAHPDSRAESHWRPRIALLMLSCCVPAENITLEVFSPAPRAAPHRSTLAVVPERWSLLAAMEDPSTGASHVLATQAITDRHGEGLTIIRSDGTLHPLWDGSSILAADWLPIQGEDSLIIALLNPNEGRAEIPWGGNNRLLILRCSIADTPICEPPTTLDTPEALSFEVDDLDGDELLDVTVLTGSQVLVYWGAASHLAERAGSSDLVAPVSGPSRADPPGKHLDIADIDADGRLDIVAIDDGTISVFFGSETHNWQKTTVENAATFDKIVHFDLLAISPPLVDIVAQTQERVVVIKSSTDRTLLPSALPEPRYDTHRQGVVTGRFLNGERTQIFLHVRPQEADILDIREDYTANVRRIALRGPTSGKRNEWLFSLLAGNFAGDGVDDIMMVWVGDEHGCSGR